MASIGENILSSIPGIGGVFSTIFGNAAARRQQQMNNEFAERMMEKQMSYNDKVTDPAYIKTRLQSAGYNPYLAGTNSLGTAIGVSQPAPSQRNIDTSSAVQGLGMAVDAFQRSRTISADNALKSAQTNNLRVEGKYIASKAIAELSKIRADTKSTEVKTSIDKIISQFTSQQQQADLNYKNQQVESAQMDIKLKALQYLGQSQQLQVLPQQIKLDLATKAADLAVRLQQKELTKKQVEHEIQKIAISTAQAASARAQAKVDNNTIGQRIEIIKQEMWRAIYNSGSDNAVQGLQYYGAKFSDWWRNLYPFK